MGLDDTSRRAVCALVAVWAIISSVLTLVGCGGGAVGGLNAAGQSTSVVINPPGGVVTNGASTPTIPAGTVSSTTTFTVGPATSFPANSELLAGSTYSIDDGNAFLQQPMTFAIQYSTLPSGAVPSSLTMYTVVNGAWRAVPGSAVNTTTQIVSAQIQAAGGSTASLLLNPSLGRRRQGQFCSTVEPTQPPTQCLS